MGSLALAELPGRSQAQLAAGSSSAGIFLGGLPLILLCLPGRAAASSRKKRKLYRQVREGHREQNNRMGKIMEFVDRGN